MSDEATELATLYVRRSNLIIIWIEMPMSIGVYFQCSLFADEVRVFRTRTIVAGKGESYE